MTPAERWKAISSSYEAMRKNQISLRDRAFAFAGSLAKALSDYLGCPDPSYVHLHRYEKGSSPDTDVFTHARGPFDAVNVEEDGSWTFGIGVTLERDERSFPKQPIQWFVRLTPDLRKCELAILPDFVELTGALDKDIPNVCLAIFNALQDILQQSVDGRPPPRRFGFVTATDS